MLDFDCCLLKAAEHLQWSLVNQDKKDFKDLVSFAVDRLGVKEHALKRDINQYISCFDVLRKYDGSEKTTRQYWKYLEKSKLRDIFPTLLDVAE